ncbi:MAG: BatD family protein [Planctomycetota bacterium]
MRSTGQHSKLIAGLLSLAALPALTVPVAAAAAATQTQKQVKTSVKLSSHVLKLGGTVRLQLQVGGTRDAQLLDIPAVDGLEFGEVFGPVPREETQIYNGQRFYKITLDWTITVRPLRAGDFDIPPLLLRIEGEDRRVPEEPLRLRVVEDLEGAELCFFEVADALERVYESQPFTLSLRFGTSIEALANVSLFLPWWPRQRGVLELEEPPGRRGSWHQFPVNGRNRTQVEELQTEVRDGVPFRVFQIERRYVATRAGTLKYDQATVEFAELLQRGSAFRPGKSKSYYAQAPSFAIEVVPVPEQGRPFEWTGAVGTLTAERRVDRRDLDQGDTIELTVSWFGDANLEFFDAPDLSRLWADTGFRVLGREDKQFADERRVIWDLIPSRADLDEIPPVPLWVFDPGRETFVLVETEPVSIRVHPVESDLTPYEEGNLAIPMDIRDLHTRPAPGADGTLIGGAVLLWSGLSLPLAWLLARTMVRRRGDPHAPLERRRRRALRNLGRELRTASKSSAQALALARFLAARTREPDHAWVGRDPRAWVSAGGGALAADALTALEALTAELDESAWAGGDEPLQATRVRRVATTLLGGGL